MIEKPLSPLAPLYLAIPTMRPELFEEAVSAAVSKAEGDIRIVGLANGCANKGFSNRENQEILSVPQNIFVVPALHYLYEHIRQRDLEEKNEESLLLYIHDDYVFHEEGWDTHIRRAFQEPLVALAGVAGGLHLGSEKLVHSAHPAWHEIGWRGPFYSNDTTSLTETWGTRATRDMDVAVLDGMALFLRRSFLDDLGGWSWWPTVHHGYDYAISCQSRKHGYRTRLLPILGHHYDDRLAVRASKSKEYLDAVQIYGGDNALFQRALSEVHRLFGNILPFRLAPPSSLQPEAPKEKQVSLTAEEWHQKDIEYSNKEYTATLLRKVKDIAKGNETAVEIGTGIGRTTRALLAAGLSRITSVDLAPANMPPRDRMAKDFGNVVTFICADSQKFDAPSCDLLIIDSASDASSLYREMARHSPKAKKHLLLLRTNLASTDAAFSVLLRDKSWSIIETSREGVGYTHLQRNGAAT